MSYKLYTFDNEFIRDAFNLPSGFTGIVESDVGTKYWFNNGDYHRIGGPALIGSNGTKKWFLNDKLHRVDGPAIIWYDNLIEWYKNGKRHRLDGPAVEYPSGNKEWWFEGKETTELEYKLLHDIMKLKGLL